MIAADKNTQVFTKAHVLNFSSFKSKLEAFLRPFVNLSIGTSALELELELELVLQTSLFPVP